MIGRAAALHAKKRKPSLSEGLLKIHVGTFLAEIEWHSSTPGLSGKAPAGVNSPGHDWSQTGLPIPRLNP
jgi:hypothetical protein